jgi:hypothetical protein
MLADGDASLAEMASNNTVWVESIDTASSTETKRLKKRRFMNPVPVGRRWVKSRIDNVAQVAPAIKSRIGNLAHTVSPAIKRRINNLAQVTPAIKGRIDNLAQTVTPAIKSRINNLAQVTPAIKSRMDKLAQTVTPEKVVQASMLMTGTWSYADRFSPFDASFDAFALAQTVAPAIKSRIANLTQTVTPDKVTQASMMMTGTWSYAERFSPFAEDRESESSLF